MKVLLIVHGSAGHVNACLGLVKILQKSGFSVIICSSPLAEVQIKTLGLDYVLLDSMPFGCGFEAILSSKYPFPYISDILLRVTDSLYHKRAKGLNQILTTVQADIILIDILYATDAFIVAEWVKNKNTDCKICYFTTKPSLGRNPYSPPVNSGQIPKSARDIDQIWTKYNLRITLKRWKQKIKYFFYFDDLSLLRDKINNYPEFIRSHPVVIRDFVGIKFAGISELVLIPTEFEFQSFQPSKTQNYIGFQFIERNESDEQITKDSLAQTIDRYKTHSKLVYCSFGSIYGESKRHIQQVLNFIDRLIKVAPTIEGVFWIISLDKTLLGQLKSNIPENFFFFKFVPQLYILSNSEIFITHGGINSIKEALHFQVPLLAYPLNVNWDQPGNAARIYYHKLGLRGDMRKDTPQAIQSKIEELLTNPIYKQNMARLNQICKEKYTDERIVEIFRNL